jgi:hypothetical protein
MHTTGVMRAGAGIGAVGDRLRQSTPGEDRASRFKAADLGFYDNLAGTTGRASRATHISAREDDHVTRVISRLSGIWHDFPHVPTLNLGWYRRFPPFAKNAARVSGSTLRLSFPTDACRLMCRRGVPLLNAHSTRAGDCAKLVDAGSLPLCWKADVAGGSAILSHLGCIRLFAGLGA